MASSAGAMAGTIGSAASGALSGAGTGAAIGAAGGPIGAGAGAIIGAGISALMSIFGNHSANKAAKDAASINAASTSKALEYEKQAAADALAYQKEQDAYLRRYQASRDSVADATLAQNRADRGPARATGQSAATTLGSLLTPGQRVNGATGVVNYANGSARSLGDLVKERSQVQPITGSVAPPNLPPQTVTLYAPDTGLPFEVSSDRADEAIKKGALKMKPVVLQRQGDVEPVKPAVGY